MKKETPSNKNMNKLKRLKNKKKAEHPLKLLKKHKDCVFLETNRFDSNNRKSLLFLNPEKIISSYRLNEIEDKLKEIEEALNKGYYAAGFVSYEAGYAFEEIFKSDKKYTFPLLWFGIYKRPYIYDKEDIFKEGLLKETYRLKNIKPNISKDKYIKNIKRIKDFIASGQTYQVNFTFKHKFSFEGSIYKLYSDLREKQKVAYSALIKFRDYSVISFSPELFFRRRGSSMETRPMKGTLERGRTLKEDIRNIESLKNSPKNRSENIMIVDLLRNDLGRISKTGSVKTKELFQVEKYETLLQMISIIKSRLKNNISLCEIFKNIFPSGSVTGAPKIETMQIIKELEKEARYVYTGSIGFLNPEKEGVFNVAIRTLIIDNKKLKGEMGIGSGIVYDSKPASEYTECLLKSKFLTLSNNNFHLIETILCKPGGRWFLLGLHLKRLKNSSKYFNFCYNRKYIKNELKIITGHFKKDKSYKVRLLLLKDGKVEIEYSLIKGEILKKIYKVKFSEKKVSLSDIFLYHKTSSRFLYNEEYKRYKREKFYDVIFSNEKEEVTESAISNIIIKKGKFYYTPLVGCGLLDGVYRQYLMNKRGFPLKEKILYKEDVKRADKIYLCNSVRGLVEVKLI